MTATHRMPTDLSEENPDFAPIVIDGRRHALTIEGIGVGLIRGAKLGSES